jgi:hypothetical protein
VSALVQAAAALAIVGALLFARRRLRSPPSGAGPRLEIVERRALGRDSGVAVVVWGEREVLVGYGASGVTGLLRADAVDEVLP